MTERSRGERIHDLNIEIEILKWRIKTVLPYEKEALETCIEALKERIEKIILGEC